MLQNGFGRSHEGHATGTGSGWKGDAMKVHRKGIASGRDSQATSFTPPAPNPLSDVQEQDGLRSVTGHVVRQAPAAVGWGNTEPPLLSSGASAEAYRKVLHCFLDRTDSGGAPQVFSGDASQLNRIEEEVD